jgi:molybdopterin converting factor small subunit
MNVQVKVATILMSKAAPPIAEPRFEVDLPEGADAEALIRTLGIPPGLVGSVTVNSRRRGFDQILVHGDAVAIIPAISGG